MVSCCVDAWAAVLCGVGLGLTCVRRGALFPVLMRDVRFCTALGFLATPLPPVLTRAVCFRPGLSFFDIVLAPGLLAVRSARVLALAMACLVMAMFYVSRHYVLTQDVQPA
jgi:hypothetical protein